MRPSPCCALGRAPASIPVAVLHQHRQRPLRARRSRHLRRALTCCPTSLQAACNGGAARVRRAEDARAHLFCSIGEDRHQQQNTAIDSFQRRSATCSIRTDQPHQGAYPRSAKPRALGTSEDRVLHPRRPPHRRLLPCRRSLLAATDYRTSRHTPVARGTLARASISLKSGASKIPTPSTAIAT
jgi:hypothetical protein